MNGFEFLKQFRKTNRGRRTPVIVWTSKDLTELERAELGSAASSVAKKDEQASGLILELKSVLGESRPSA